MIMDCMAFSEFTNGMGIRDTENFLAGFNSISFYQYSDCLDAIEDNCDRVYREDKYEAMFDTYVFSRESLDKLEKDYDKDKHGEDFNEFISLLKRTKYNTFYIQFI